MRKNKKALAFLTLLAVTCVVVVALTFGTGNYSRAEYLQL